MIKDLFSGIAAYKKAITLIFKEKLWGYIAIPILISLLLAVAVFGSAWGLSDDIGSVIAGWYPLERGSETVLKISNVFGGLLVAIIGVLLYKNLVMVIAGPFMSLLSEKVENSLTGNIHAGGLNPARIIKDLIRGLRIALRNITREIFFTGILLILGLIPIFSLFSTIGIFIVQAYYAGFGNFDYYLERHHNVRESIRYIKRNRWAAIGNGVVFVGLLLTIIGFLFAPVLGAIAATINGTQKSQTSL